LGAFSADPANKASPVAMALAEAEIQSWQFPSQNIKDWD
jgi:hypothetical protein